MLRAAATSLVMCACSIPAIDLTGKACPCPSPYVCEPSTNTCALGRGGGDAQSDSPDSTCAVDVLAHTSTTCAIRSDHTMWCAGQNNHGQLGDGTTMNVSSFVQVAMLAGVKQIALGSQNSFALDSQGVVWAWGAGERGALGNGLLGDSSTPIAVPMLPKISRIAAGESHACAVDAFGTLYCWGWNTNGQIGNGMTVDQPTPLQIMTGVATVAAGGRRTCVIKKLDSSVWCWGKNTEGEVGDGTTDTPKTTPTKIPSFDAIELATGGHHACARRADNTVWCWGRSTFGQMGNGSLTQQLSPMAVPNVGPSVVALSADGGRRTCATLTGGDVVCWGETPFGIRSVAPPQTIDLPKTVPELANASVLATASDHTCTIMADHALRCAGQNDHGQLADGTTMPHFAFMPTTLPCP